MHRLILHAPADEQDGASEHWLKSAVLVCTAGTGGGPRLRCLISSNVGTSRRHTHKGRNAGAAASGPPSGSIQHLAACIGGEDNIVDRSPALKPMGKSPVRPQHVSACVHRSARFGAPSASRKLFRLQVMHSMLDRWLCARARPSSVRCLIPTLSAQSAPAGSHPVVFKLRGLATHAFACSLRDIAGCGGHELAPLQQPCGPWSYRAGINHSRAE